MSGVTDALRRSVRFDTLTNKTITTPTLTLKQSTTPTPTAEGDIQWDTDNDIIIVGDGSSQKLFYPVLTGSVTPVIYGGTTAGVGTYVAQEGAYQRIRNWVWFWIHAQITAHTGSGAFNIDCQGLPNAAGGSAISHLMLATTRSNDISGRFVEGTNDIFLYDLASGGNTQLTLDVACNIFLSGHYQAA